MNSPLWFFIVPLLILALFGLIPVFAMRNKKPGSVWSYVRYGREQAKKRISSHWLPLLIIALVLGVLSFVQQKFGTTLLGVDEYGIQQNALNAIGRATQVIMTLFGVVYGIGMIKLGLHGAEDKPYSLSNMFSHPWKQLWKYVVTALLYTVLLFAPLALLWGLAYVITSNVSWNIGMILSIILGVIGIIWFVRILFRVGLTLYYVVVDHADTMNPVQMIRHARDISKWHVRKLFSVGLTAGLTNILGFLALGVGLLWTIPLTQIATAKLYREIDDAYHKHTDDALEA